MRVSTAFRFDESVDSLQRRQREMSDVQAAMTNGKRINTPSDDPTGAARAERAFITQKRIEHEQRLVDASRNALNLAESTLGSAMGLMQDARETMVLAGNASFTASERAAQVLHLRSLRSQLMSLANMDDGAGGFVFGGQSGHTQPFVDTPQGVTSNAAPGQQQLSQREYMPTTLDGGAVWLSAATGNGVFVNEANPANTGQAWISPGTVTNPSALTGSNYELVFSVGTGGTTFTVLQNGGATALTDQPYRPTSAIEIDGLSVNITGQPADGDRFAISPSSNSLNPFLAIDRAIAVLDDKLATSSQVTQAVNNGLRDMDSVLRQFQGARSSAGAALNRLDSVDNRNQDRTLWAERVQSETEDVDMVKAISEFQNKQSSYQAALQSYAMVQRMSLFDYLK